jgi:hypothetical protein
MAIKLIVESLEPEGARDDLVCEQSLITFGKSNNCTVQLNNNQASTRHFLVRFTEGQYIIMDEGSALGTMLDGEFLEPLISHPLHEQHQIDVPGYTISLFNDGNAPRLERTTVVARKMIGRILGEAHDGQHLPRIEDLQGRFSFFFDDDRSTFILGSGNHCDFVLPSEDEVAKEHVSFIRDILGVRIVPINGAKALVSEEDLSEQKLMKHGELISLGNIKLIFKEHADDSLPLMKEVPKAPMLLAPPINEELLISDLAAEVEPRPVLFITDKLIFALLLIVTAGASWIFVALL